MLKGRYLWDILLSHLSVYWLAGCSLLKKIGKSVAIFDISEIFLAAFGLSEIHNFPTVLMMLVMPCLELESRKVTCQRNLYLRRFLH